MGELSNESGDYLKCDRILRFFSVLEIMSWEDQDSAKFYIVLTSV